MLERPPTTKDQWLLQAGFGHLTRQISGWYNFRPISGDEVPTCRRKTREANLLAPGEADEPKVVHGHSEFGYWAQASLAGLQQRRDAERKKLRDHLPAGWIRPADNTILASYLLHPYIAGRLARPQLAEVLDQAGHGDLSQRSRARLSADDFFATAIEIRLAAAGRARTRDRDARRWPMRLLVLLVACLVLAGTAFMWSGLFRPPT